MKKKMYVLGMAALVAALLGMSGVAQSAMWVGAQIGGNFNPSTDIQVNALGFTANLGTTHIEPSVIGGATIGYDFVNAGFGAYAWPDWMKYFSFALDFTYNKLNVRDVGLGAFGYGNLGVQGYEVALTFLFMAHYGFMPDSEAPGGRINPYIGVGPAILWTGIEGKLPAIFPNTKGTFDGSAMNVALVVEPGIRWMCFKNVSVDTAMRYRYSQPSWSGDFYNVNVTLKANPLHQIAFLLRANYHF